MARIGILGGSFNPLHLGHLLMGRSAAEAFNLDKVLLVPCAVSPFKQGATDLAPGADRLEMVRLSTEGDVLFEPSAIDLARGGVSYALDTVREVRALYAGDRVFFIMGMDSLRELRNWHRVMEMLELCDVITVARPGVDAPVGAGELDFPKDVRERLTGGVVKGRLFDVSSSEIRRRIAEGRTIRYLVPLAVEAYIASNGLYGCDMENGRD
ncbi:MAG: nicotinate-nucleotide adenylyltransferase [Kiritimatiellae bacterium]|nr:nicotinate-nucleotide adenylyltransferase [Kiritimatiellia bacterium]